MTREEIEKAIKILRWVFYRIMFADSDNPYCTPPTEEEIKWAGSVAIEALEQEPSEDMTIAYLMGYYADKEPCDDAVSREDARMMLTCEIKDGMTITEYIKMVDKRLRNLPSVRPQEPKTGHWIIDEGSLDALYGEVCKCSKCGVESIGESDYCPNCGCRMVEPQESEVRNDL